MYIRLLPAGQQHGVKHPGRRCEPAAIGAGFDPGRAASTSRRALCAPGSAAGPPQLGLLVNLPSAAARALAADRSGGLAANSGSLVFRGTARRARILLGKEVAPRPRRL